MTDTEKIGAAMELLGNISAAALHNGGIIAETAPFAEDRKKIGSEQLKELIGTGRAVLCGQYLYKAEVSDNGGYSVAVITKRSVAGTVPEPDPVTLMQELSADIRSSVTTVGAALDHTFNKGRSYGIMPRDAAVPIENANRAISSLFGKSLLYDDLILYRTQSRINTVSADLYRLMKGMARDAANITKQYSVRMTAYGRENSYAVIRLDTVRIIFSAAVREILLMKYKPEYIDINVFSDDKHTGFTITGGTLAGKRNPIKPYPQSVSRAKGRDGSLSFEALADALTDAFCERFGGECYKLRNDFMYHMGITLPKDEHSPRNETEKKVELKNSYYDVNSKFSFENCIISDAVYNDKYVSQCGY